jgi:hypothetical protein
MASLESLPAPLPLYIAKDLPDLKALDALRHSSALFASVFARHAVELLEHLMSTTLHEETITELRVHVLLVVDLPRCRRTDMAVEKLYEDSQSPLPRAIPVEAISLTLRTFSFLHFLGGQVTEAKLLELYALPHYTSKCNYDISSFYTTEGTPYDVPAPSPLDWTEEQRILKSLFHIRIHALLGLQIHQPPPLSRCLWKFSLVYECYRLFKDNLPEITQISIPTSPSCWRAPASRSVEHLQDWPNDSDLTGNTTGWTLFHARCALRSHLRSPMSHTDWIVFSDLGMAIWSQRRLALDLALVHTPRRVRDPSESRPNFAFSWWMLGRARIPAKNDKYSFLDVL